MLCPQTFQTIQETFGPLNVDLFASRLTHQMPRFFGWRPDPLAEAVDAFQQDWGPMKGFANPLWCLISRVLSQAHHQQAQLVLVAPVWRGETWYPVLLERLWDFPRTNRCPDEDSPSTSRVVCLRERFSSNCISEEATKLLLQSWRSKSAQSYNSQFRKWAVWCAERNRSPISGLTSDVANFLAELYEEGYKAISLNSFRSAIPLDLQSLLLMTRLMALRLASIL